MKKNLGIGAVFVLIVIVFIYPQVSFAKWYNPLTWFKHAPEASQSVTVPITETTITSPSTGNGTPVTITKTITIHDPADAKTIAGLRTELEEYKGRYTSCDTERMSLSKTISALKSAGGVPIQILGTPLTRDQLIAKYRIAHPYSCNPSAPEAHANPSYCVKMQVTYNANMNIWVDNELANQ